MSLGPDFGFAARLAASRLPLAPQERAAMERAAHKLARLAERLHEGPLTATTDPLDLGTSPPPPAADAGARPMPTVEQMAGSMARGDSRSRDWAELCLARIRHHDPALQTFLTVTAERALRDADRADAERAAGTVRSRLHGVPYALKDAIDTAGIRTTVGSRIFADRVPAEDAEIVRRLDAAGAVLIGKLDTTEFCLGGPSTDGGFGPARNPWGLDRYAGASSSGAGAAIAAGLVPLAFGTDTGGSIRIPAAFTGVAGFKPTQGLIPTAGVFPLSGSLDHVGPLAATPGDCVLALAAVAGLAERPARTLEGLRVGVPRGHGGDCPGAHPEARRALATAVAALHTAGARVEAVELPGIWSYSAVCSLVMMFEAWQGHADRLAEAGHRYSSLTRLRIGLGAFVDRRDYEAALALRPLLAEAWDAACEKVDVLLTLGSPGPAPLRGDMDPFYFLDTPLIFSAPNVVGAPALVLRAGTSAEGLPIGVQLAGRRGDDRGVLAAGTALAPMLPCRPAHPPGFAPT